MNFYIAVTVEQNRNESIFTDKTAHEYNPGLYAYVIKCTENDNIKAVLERIGGLLHANIYPTRRQAAETMKAWNEAYKRNGTYLFNTPAF